MKVPTATAMGIVTCLFATALPAQSILDQIESDIDSRVDDLSRAEELLQNPDPNRRVAAMEALLKSGDEALANKAKEVGLFSDDPRLRAAAVRGVLDAGGPFRAEFIIPTDDPDLTAIYDWLRIFKGSWSQDRSQGFYGFVVGEYDDEEECWKFLNSRACAFRMSGEDVMAEWAFNITGSSVMRLDDTGALTGPFLVNGRGTPVTIRIPLID